MDRIVIYGHIRILLFSIFKKVKISFEIGSDISSIICIGFLVAY